MQCGNIQYTLIIFFKLEFFYLKTTYTKYTKKHDINTHYKQVFIIQCNDIILPAKLERKIFGDPMK